MPCLKTFAKNLFAFATLGCLGISGLAFGASLRLVDSSVDNDSGRGSGRVSTQVPQTVGPNGAVAYRGTGRLHNGHEPVTAHRGSGRIDTQDPQSSHTAYRGSGRISPLTMTSPEYA
jgi:hypothetical protein